jgi:hypothetical protein
LRWQPWRSPRKLGIWRIERIIESQRLAPSQLEPHLFDLAIAKVVSIHASILLVLPATQQKIDELPRRVGRVFLMW